VISFMVFVEAAFFVVFAVELVLRIGAERCPGFLFNTWNLLDALIVVSSAVDLFFELAFNDPSAAVGDVGKIQAVRILKITRLVRTVRVIRIFRFKRLMRAMRGLMLLLNAIIGALRALGWVMLIIALTTYLFAIVTTEFIGLADEENDPLLQQWFGDMFSSMYTLMQLSTLDEWAPIARHVGEKLGVHWQVFFLVYVLATSMVLMNVALATLIQNVISLNAELKSVRQGHVPDEEVESWMRTPSSLASDDEKDETGDLNNVNAVAAAAAAALAANGIGVGQQSAVDRLTAQTLTEFFEMTATQVGIEGVNQRRLVTQHSLADALLRLDVQEKLFQICPALRTLEASEMPARILGACPKRLDKDGMLRQELVEACLALRGDLSMNHFVQISQALQQMERHIDHELVHLNKHQRKINRRFLKLRHRLRKVYHFDGAPRKMVELVNDMRRKHLEAAAAGAIGPPGSALPGVAGVASKARGQMSPGAGPHVADQSSEIELSSSSAATEDEEDW